MKTNKALIVSTETNLNLVPFKNHLLIGVERGCLDLISKNIKIDIAISDFDHVLDEELKLIQDNSNECIVLDKEKDYIDGEEAIVKAKSMGFDEITFIAKPSKRYDMNFSVLYFIEKYNIKLINDETVIFKLKKGMNTISFENFQGYTYISLIPLEKTVVSISGLKYEVENLLLEKNSARATSNCFIPYKDGIINSDKELIIIFSK